MIKRIELVDFMSHRHSVFELGDGLTVLTGPNNCGKSAVVSALQILCYNDNSTWVLRHGARECRVTVETADGHVISWSRRRNGSPRYEVDGEVFDRLGRGEDRVPEAVHRILGLPRIQSDRDEYDVHFGTQRNPVFLLNDPPGLAADFFASSSDATRLVEMQSVHKQRVRDANARFRQLTDERQTVTRHLESFQPLDPALEQLAAAEQAHTRLNRQQQETETLGITINAIGEIRGELARLDRCLAVSNQLAAPARPHDTTMLHSTIQAMQSSGQQLEQDRRWLEATSRLQPPLPPQPESGLRELVGLLEQADTALVRAQHLTAVASGLKAFPNLPDPAGLASVLHPMDRLHQELQGHDGRLACLQAVSPVPESCRNTDQLRMLTDQLGQQEKQLVDLEHQLQENTHQQQETEQHLNALVRTRPECPVCGSPVSTPQLLSSRKSDR